MKSKKIINLDQQSKTHIPIDGQSIMNKFDKTADKSLQDLIDKQNNRKKKLALWTSLAEGRIQSISSSINLFIILLINTLGGKKYNGGDGYASWVLGWIAVAQVTFSAVIIILLKAIHLPSLERDIQESFTQGLQIYHSIRVTNTSIKCLDIPQIQKLEKTIKQNGDIFKKCFPFDSIDHILTDINAAYGPEYKFNRQLHELKLRETNAKYWQSFWQIFIVNKTFTTPSVILLLFIIIPASIANQTKDIKNAQGWIIVGIWSTAIVLYITIKFVWDFLDDKVYNSKSYIFNKYRLVNIKKQQLKDLSLAELQELQKILFIRRTEFQACFPNQNPSNSILLQRLPNREGAEEVQLKKIILQQKHLQSRLTQWTSFCNLRIIPTIINCFRLLMISVNTFVTYYPTSVSATQTAKIIIGSVGIIIFVLGYSLYIFLRSFYLGYLQEKVYLGRSNPFMTYRLVYYGNKKIEDLQVHQLEDVQEVIDLRKQEFERCFPKSSVKKLKIDIKALIKEKISPYPATNRIKDLLEKQNKAKKIVKFWSDFVDNDFLTGMYSVFALLVVLVISLTSVYQTAHVMGWIGVANVGLLILIVVFFKTFLLQYLSNNAKALRVEGYSQFNNVYNKSKQLHDIDIYQLEKIALVIETNPIEFRRCFPNASLQSTLLDIQQVITHKVEQQKNSQTLSPEQLVKRQILNLQLIRNKASLQTWRSIITQRLFIITPNSIVIHILWSQSIATTLQGVAVCGFLTVATIALIIFLICFYNCYYKEYLQERIKECERNITELQTRKKLV